MESATRLFSELRRRRVFHTAGFYIVGAWVVLQVADLAFESWELPDPALKAVWAAIFALFPVAILFGWLYDITSKGIVRTPPAGSDASLPLRRGDYGVITGIVGAVAIVFIGLVAHVSNQHAVRQSDLFAVEDIDPQSIAVLPFATRSNVEDTVYFADGVHDDLLTTLANISDLKVISRTSVLEYRRTTKNMRQIGRELGAANVLEGGIQHVGDHVRINVQLIDAQTDEHLWAQTFDRVLSIENLFAIQTEIAETISKQLATTLSPEERTRIRRNRTDNLDAFNLYIKGKHQYIRSSFESLRTAADLFTQAIDIDPDYALARTALANTYLMLANTGAAKTDEMLGEGRPHIDHAIELDPTNGYTLAVLARFESMAGEADPRATFARALEQSPNNVEVLDLYASFLRGQDRNEEALVYINRALELDPLSTSLFHDLGRASIRLGLFDDAYKAFERISQIDPENPYATHGAAMATILSGRLGEAGYWSDKAAVADPLDFENPSTSTFVYMSAGDPETAKLRMEEAIAMGPDEPYPLAAQAYYLTVTGEHEKAVGVARAALAKQLEDRWRSQFVFLRILINEAVASGNPDEALAWFRQLRPELFEDTPGVNSANIQKAADLAHLLMLSGEDDRARAILDTVISFYDANYSKGSANYPMGIAKVDALALLGREADALAELQRVVDDGWRLLWRWDTEYNRNLDSLRDNPKFDSIIAWIEDDLEEQARQFAEKEI